MSEKRADQFSGERLAHCQEFAQWGDLARALLEPEKEYTKAEARKRLNEFMERKVNN